MPRIAAARKSRCCGPVGAQGQIVACHFAESIAASGLLPEAEPPYARRLAALRKLAAA